MCIRDSYTSTSSAATTYTIPSFASATWTYFNNTFTLTTGCTNGLQVTIALGTSLTTGSFNLTGLQAEVGSVATPYERQIYSDQLAQCQRYYWRLTQSSAQPAYTAYGSGFAGSTTAAYIYLPTKVSMRTASPSVDVPATITKLKLTNIAATNYTISAIALEASSGGDTFVLAVTSSSLTTGYSYSLGNNNDTSGFLGLSTEL